jgi:hypothetical protein
VLEVDVDLGTPMATGRHRFITFASSGTFDRFVRISANGALHKVRNLRTRKKAKPGDQMFFASSLSGVPQRLMVYRASADRVFVPRLPAYLPPHANRMRPTTGELCLASTDPARPTAYYTSGSGRVWHRLDLARLLPADTLLNCS